MVNRTLAIVVSTVCLYFPISPCSQARESSELILVGIGSEIFTKSKTNQPFLDYLANNLKKWGIKRGKLVLAEDIYGAAKIMNQGEADLFIDSAYPVLMMRKLAGAKLLVRRWKKGVEAYNTVIFTHKDSSIDRLEDLMGQRIAFEEPWSTSGYFMPKSLLLEQGFRLKENKSIDMPLVDSKINYIFSESDETTMVWVLRNRVAAGAIDLPNFKQDAKQKIDQLKILYTSEPIPRQLVSYGKNLNPELVQALQQVLLAMDRSEQGRAVLKKYKKPKNLI